MPEPIEIAQVSQASVQKATGPRSKVGKQRSSRNAIKHGIFSDVTVLPGESGDRYDSLLTELQEALQPEGRLEELLVEKLASLAWRHRRLLVAEGAEIRQGTEFLGWDRQNQERQKKAAGAVDLEHLFDRDPSLIHKIQDPAVLDDCLELLGELRQQIDSGGFDKEQDIEILQHVYGSEARGTLRESYVAWAETAEVSEEERERERLAAPDQCKKEILSEIDKEIRRLRACGRERMSVESERAKLEVLRNSIPSPAKLDRLLRYEASLERAFDRTLNQIERMQRLRRGQPVAPRIDVDVSS